jgi:uncharacterized protein YndB with AHSA1/START domain
MKWLLMIVGALAGLIAVMFVIGKLLPVAHTASRSVELKAPPEKIWQLLTQFADYPQWRKELKQVEMVNEKTWKGIDSHGESITFALQEAQTFEKMVTVIADKNLPFGGSWMFALKANAATTTLTITENGEVYNPLFRFMSKFIFGHTATLEKYLENLKSALGEN